MGDGRSICSERATEQLSSFVVYKQPSRSEPPTNGTDQRTRPAQPQRTDERTDQRTGQRWWLGAPTPCWPHAPSPAGMHLTSPFSPPIPPPSSPPRVHARRRPSRDTFGSHLRQSITSKWCCVYGTPAPCPVSPQSQPNGGNTKTTGPSKVLSLVRAKLSYKMATLWDTAGASALGGTSEQMSSLSLYKPPCGSDPPSNGLRKHR